MDWFTLHAHRFPKLFYPLLLLIAVGAVLLEIVFRVELCPLRDWALTLAGTSYHCCSHHEGTHHEH
jgi:hypothetical protein